MTFFVVVVVLAVLLAAANGTGVTPNVPDDEQLKRDEEDIAIYGAIVRPPVDEDRHGDRGGYGC